MFPTRPDHKSGCTKPDPIERATLERGDVIMQCRGCNTRWAVPPQAAPQPKAAPLSAYVCRVHHDQSVTWRGTGCTKCTRTTKQRKASQPSDYEMET